MRQKILNILVTGASGQLGCALQEEYRSFEGMTIFFLTKAALDVTDRESIEVALNTYIPDIIINTAAYTAVDKAEVERIAAYKLNNKAVEYLAKEAQKRKIALIHISTDYVFDGKQKHPYTSDDVPNPQTIYGKSKLAGEQAILAANLERFAIIRTSWLYSEFGNNFVKTILRLAQERSKISVVDDQMGSPTWTNDLARAILTMAPQLTAENKGVYHYTNEGEVSWYAFAKAIFYYKNITIQAAPVTSAQYPTDAQRPKNSTLDSSKIKAVFGVGNYPWEQSLRRMLSRLDTTDV